MTLSAVFDTDLARSDEAGASLGDRIRDAFDERPDAVILFASPRCGTEAIPDAVVALEILSNKPLGIGVRHGWLPGGDPLRVTEAKGMRLGSLNAWPPACAWARSSGFELDAVRSALGDTPFAGCNSIGQIARSEGQMSGFHNCTAVVCVTPE
jgi:hypothetical protein